MISRQENGKWLVDIRNNGRGSKRVRKNFETKREASEFECWYKAQQSIDIWEKQKDTRRLSFAIQRTWIEVGKFQSSGKDKNSRLLKICMALNDPLLKDINAEMLMRYRSKRISEDDIEAETANKEMIFVASVMRHAGVTPPIIKKLKVIQEELRYLENDEIKKLLDYIKDRSFCCYIVSRICLETGARWGESSSVLPHHAKNEILQLPSKHTKNNKPRYIPISNELQELIVKNAPFPDTLSTFRRSVEACKIELPDGQMTHVLRHSFASHFVMNGGNIVALQKVLDHCSLNVTMRYAHLSPGHLKEVLRFKPSWELMVA